MCFDENLEKKKACYSNRGKMDKKEKLALLKARASEKFNPPQVQFCLGVKK